MGSTLEVPQFANEPTVANKRRNLQCSGVKFLNLHFEMRWLTRWEMLTVTVTVTCSLLNTKVLTLVPPSGVMGSTSSSICKWGGCHGPFTTLKGKPEVFHCDWTFWTLLRGKLGTTVTVTVTYNLLNFLNTSYRKALPFPLRVQTMNPWHLE